MLLSVELSIALLIVAVAGELLFARRLWWRWRKITGPTVAGILVIATGTLAVATRDFPIGLMAGAGVVLITAYSLFNIARLVSGQASEEYIRRSAVTTFAWLGLAHVFLAMIILNTWYMQVSFTWCLMTLAAVQLLVAVIVAWSTRRQLRTTQLPDELPEISDGNLPTITVAVPVRNEEQQLEACLTSILASNYPKLEILAFDDNSSDRTPDIIRQYAHSGVRFLRSGKPAGSWLAKNQAYNELAKAASGEVLLFCGADVRFDVRTIRHLVALMDDRHKTMLTVLPQNRVVRHVPLLQAMRYYWEMAPPRRLFNRPPVLSSLWLIRRKTLEDAGSFAAVRRSVSPEAHLAAYAASHDDGYSFVCGNEVLGAWSEKPDHEQQATAILRRYPQVHRRPEMVLVFALGQAVLLLGLLAVLAIGLGLIISGTERATAGWVSAVLALTALVLHTQAFGAILRGSFTRLATWRMYAAFIPSIALDVVYLHRSMYHYEFSDITWKGRNVSKSVMRRSDSV